MILKSVKIENFLVISNVVVEFDYGLTVISGESGAGKSTIIDALCWCLGVENKRTKDITNAHVIVEFSENLIISREGKNSFKFNGKKIGKKELFQKELMIICRQDHRLSFATTNNFRDMIDELLDDKNELEKLKSAYFHYKSIKDEINDLINLHNQDLDYIRNVILEIESLNLEGNDDERLVLQRREETEIYKSYESLVKAMQILKDSSNVNGIMSQINNVVKYLNSNSPMIAELQQRVEYIRNELSDIETSIYDIVSRSSSNEARLDIIDKQLSQIRDIARKYRVTPNELMLFLEDHKNKLYLAENLAIKKDELQKTLYIAEEEFRLLSSRVNHLREIVCDDLNSRIRTILDELMMGDVNAYFELCKTTWGESGDVQIKINIGKRVLSGGEISRLLLAIKIASVTSHVPIIFDEIDLGVGGMTAHKIGGKLRELAEIGQVIVVTHQAQVAAHGMNHVLVSRDSVMQIEKLSTEERVVEIARMISGSKTTPESLSAAKKLIEECINN